MDEYKEVYDSLYDFQKEIVNEIIEKKTHAITLNMVMGIGKSSMSVVLGLMSSDKPILIIASKTLIMNWKEELDRLGLDYIILFKDNIKDIDNFVLPANARIVITTPQLVSKRFKKHNLQTNVYTTTFVANQYYQHLGFNTVQYKKITKPIMEEGNDVIFSTDWGTLIIDEIHNYTNYKSLQCNAILGIYSDYIYGLSGTLFSEPKLNFLYGYLLLMRVPELPNRYDLATEYFNSDKFVGYKDTIIRRTEIPNFIKPKENKIIINHDLNKFERVIYSSLVKCIQSIISELEKNTYNIAERNRDKVLNTYKMMILQYVQHSIICPIYIYSHCIIQTLDFNNDGELSNMILDRINKAITEESDVDIMAYLNTPEACYSTRILEIQKIIDANPDKKIILYTYFRTNLDVMMELLSHTRKKHTITANMKTTERDDIIQTFKKTKNDLLLLTYTIGSEGLNLQECDIIIFTDLFWNVAKMQQSCARIFRPGQLSPSVTYYYLVANVAIEHYIVKKHQDKLILADEMLNGNINHKVESINVKDIVKILLIDDVEKIKRMFDNNINDRIEKGKVQKIEDKEQIRRNRKEEQKRQRELYREKRKIKTKYNKSVNKLQDALLNNRDYLRYEVERDDIIDEWNEKYPDDDINTFY